MKSSIHSRSVFGKLFIVAAACAAVQRADATLLFEDGFNYSAGAFGPADTSPAGLSGNAWTGGSSHITVVSGGLTYTGLQDLGGNSISDAWGTSAGSVVNTYTGQTSGSIYYSFLLDATALPTITASSAQFLTSLNPGTSLAGGSKDALSVNVMPAAGGGGYEIGVRTANESIVYDTADLLAVNTTYLVVAEYTFGAAGTSLASLYLDPTAGGSQPGATVTVAGDGSVTSIANVGFKAQGATANGTFQIDNLLIGTSWGDVTPVATAAPEPGSLSLIMAGLGALGFAMRNRRARK
jgi:hypothetical protein